jgi:23S rRNA pseudouridine1911/1915/1917 synthase
MANGLLKLFRNKVEVLHLDNHLLVVRKPAGMLSQGDATGDPDLLSMAREFIRAEFQKPGEVFLGLVHRLDRPVGGVMVFARTSKAASRLSEQIRERTIRKEYMAVVEGMAPESGVLKDRLSKDADSRTTLVVGGGAAGKDASFDLDQGKESELSFIRLAVRDSGGGLSDDGTSGGRPSAGGRTKGGNGSRATSLLSVDLKTGRSHQIRAQLSHAGHPIVGDNKYGGRRLADLGLFASSLEFRHPTRDERLVFTAQPPRHAPWSDFHEAYVRNTEGD